LPAMPERNAGRRIALFVLRGGAASGRSLLQAVRQASHCRFCHQRSAHLSSLRQTGASPGTLLPSLRCFSPPSIGDESLPPLRRAGANDCPFLSLLWRPAGSGTDCPYRPALPQLRRSCSPGRAFLSHLQPPTDGVPTASAPVATTRTLRHRRPAAAVHPLWPLRHHGENRPGGYGSHL